MFINLSFSPPISFSKGIPVHFDTTLAISSALITSFIIVACSFLFNSSYSFWRLGSKPYMISLAFVKSPLLWAPSRSSFAWSILSFKFLFVSSIFFSDSQVLLSIFSFSWISDIWLSIFSFFFSSFSLSFERTFFSICSLIRSLSSWSISSGLLSISILTLLAASSIKSIALSGKKRSVIYRSDNWTDDKIASSLILIPWWISYFSFRPLKIATASVEEGSLTKTGWKRLVKAASFSKYFLYSSKVVAPTQCNSPLANAGFSMLDASIAPSVFPAPTSVWISSINKIIEPFCLWISFKTFWSLSSNSPRYLAPASNNPRSRIRITLFSNERGTSLFAILCAKPSINAVLPTPGSPINIGLFLVLLDKTWIVLLISSSLPITGSNSLFCAFWVTLIVYFSKALKLSSEFSLSDFPSFLNSWIFVLTNPRLSPFFFNIFSIWSSDFIQLKNKESIDTKLSWLDFAIFSASSKRLNNLGSA